MSDTKKMSITDCFKCVVVNVILNRWRIVKHLRIKWNAQEKKTIKKWSPDRLFKFTSLGGLLSKSQLWSRFFPQCDFDDSDLWCELGWLTCSLLRRLNPPPKFFFRHSANRLFLRSPFGVSLPLFPLPFNWLSLFSLPFSLLPSRFPWSLSLRCWRDGLLLLRRLLWLPFAVTSGRWSGGGTSGPIKDKYEPKLGSLFFGIRAGHAHAPWHPFLQ